MKFENIYIYGFQNALRGMRNSKNSLELSDSTFGYTPINTGAEKEIIFNYVHLFYPNFEEISEDSQIQILKVIHQNIWINFDLYSNLAEYAALGPKDLRLATSLIKSGQEYRKFLRQIIVSLDITAPLYWWQQFDTYSIDITENSTSLIQKLINQPITINSFEISDYDSQSLVDSSSGHWHMDMMVELLVQKLEEMRIMYLSLMNDKKFTEAKIIEKELLRWLPMSYLQARTVTMNYENLLSIVHQKKNNKLIEWSTFIDMVTALPYAGDFIFINNEELNNAKD